MMIDDKKYLSLKSRVSHRYYQQALEKLDRTRLQIPAFPLSEGQNHSTKRVTEGRKSPCSSGLLQQQNPCVLFMMHPPCQEGDTHTWTLQEDGDPDPPLLLPLPMASCAGPVPTPAASGAV